MEFSSQLKNRARPTMRRNRGFKLARKLIRVFKWVTRRKGNSCKYEKLEGPKTQRSIKAISKLCKWGRSIRKGFFNQGKRGYIRVGHDPIDTKRAQIPKGHLAVYVGEREDETKRVLVPVLFLNHPLFGKLLKEAEDVYGFDHPGRIMIPCPISEFENVQTKIATTGDKCRPWVPRHHYVPGVKCLSL